MGVGVNMCVLLQNGFSVLTVEATEKIQRHIFLPSDNITVPWKHHYFFMERRKFNYKNTRQYEKIGQL